MDMKDAVNGGRILAVNNQLVVGLDVAEILPHGTYGNGGSEQ